MREGMLRHKRKISTFLTIMLAAQLILSVIPFPFASAEDHPPPKTQKISKKVKSDPNGWDGIVWWYQQDNGKFVADFPDGTQPESPNAGSIEQPYPAPYRKSFIFPDITSWTYATWEGGYKSSEISNIELLEATWPTDPTKIIDVTVHGNPVIINNKKSVWVDVTSGGKIPSDPENYYRYGTSGKTGQPKFVAGYLVPLRLVWQGEVYQEKEIDVNPDTAMQVGQTKQLNASVRTKDWGKTSWGNWEDVRTSPETEWKSENPAVATVSSTGVVTA
jgi:hypothetical protein